VDETELERKLEKAAKSKNAASKTIKSVELQYTLLLCPKGKKECEPAYCSFRISDTCPFLEKWHFLVKKYNVSP
jgi:hypothetical protein